MLHFNEYKKLYLDNIYSENLISESKILIDYKLFDIEIKESRKLVISFLSKDGIKVDDNTIDHILNENSLNNEYKTILNESAVSHLELLYCDKRIDDSGTCLLKNLIGKACQMVHNEDILGIVTGYDKSNSRFLMVDFGGEKNDVKVDIQELKIVGQKR